MPRWPVICSALAGWRGDPGGAVVGSVAARKGGALAAGARIISWVAEIFEKALFKDVEKDVVRDALKTTEKDVASDAGRDAAKGAWHGEDGLALEPDQNAAADRMLAHARDAEPKLTGDVSAVAGQLPGARLEGLDFRLKGEDSFKRKLATDLFENPGRTADEALANVKDSVRYTMMLPRESYGNGVDRAVAALQERGYENVTWKNTWLTDGYKGINSTWRDPGTGQVFEVQFHTQGSFDAKMTTHGLYEQERLPGTPPDEVARLHSLQAETFRKVPVPPGAGQIVRPGPGG